MRKALLLSLALVTIALVIIFQVNSSSFQEKLVRKEILAIAETMAEHDTLCSKFTSFEGFRSKQYEHFELLKKQATTQELKLLTDHPNLVVRCYAFWGLADLKVPHLLPLALKYIEDNASVITYFGCVREEQKVVDFYLSLLTRNYVITADYYHPNSSHLTPEEKNQLDSTLIFTPNQLDYTEELLTVINPNPIYYTRIRQLAQRGSSLAIVALAKYQRVEDLELILESKSLPRKGTYYLPLEYTFQAISCFPHPYFFPYLQKYSQDLWKEEFGPHYFYYQAVASYRNPQALAILTEPMRRTKEQMKEKYINMERIFSAMTQFRTDIYEESAYQLWEKEQYRRADLLIYLWEGDSLQCQKRILNKLSLKSFNDQSWDSDTEALLNKVLELQLKSEKSQAIKSALLEQVSDCPDHFFWVYIHKIIHLQDKQFIGPLLKKMITTSNIVVFRLSVMAILTYEQNEFDDRVFSALRSNEFLHSKYPLSSANALKEVQDMIQNRKINTARMMEVN
jgi:hypothetical protein